MNTRKVFIHCCTVYQLIVAIQLRLTVYQDVWCGIIISKTTPNSIKIKERLKECNIFDYAVVIDNETVDWNLSKMILWNNIKVFLRPLLVDVVFSSGTIIDEYLFAGLGGFSNALGQWFVHVNRCEKIGMYEEGASSYSRIYAHAIEKRTHNPSALKRVYYKMFPHMLSKIQKFYFFDPELLLWDVRAEIVRVPAISDRRERLLAILNHIFDIENCPDDYDKPVIFFEESYHNDGIVTGDVQIVDALAKQYGKENIFIKVHPRNSDNRFQKLGYHTNIDFSIPWEVIALNMDNLDKKILATMTSTALINTFLVLHSNADMRFYYDGMIMDDPRVKHTVEVMEKAIKLYPLKFRKGSR